MLNIRPIDVKLIDNLVDGDCVGSPADFSKLLGWTSGPSRLRITPPSGGSCDDNPHTDWGVLRWGRGILRWPGSRKTRESRDLSAGFLRSY
jgi:hypothetical protein